MCHRIQHFKCSTASSTLSAEAGNKTDQHSIHRFTTASAENAQTGSEVEQHVQDNAEESVRRVITALKDGAYTLALDNGAQIAVKVMVG